MAKRVTVAETVSLESGIEQCNDVVDGDVVVIK